MNKLPVLDQIEASISELRSRLAVVQAESIRTELVPGRFLAQPIVANRDSPSADVSAMDGYAVRLSDISSSAIPVAGVAKAGYPPLVLPLGGAIRIFTGAVIPEGTECVIRREDCDESSQEAVRFLEASHSAPIGINIRKCGENIQKGGEVIPKGEWIGPHRFAGLVTFSETSNVLVYRTLRVTVVTTGDELVPSGHPLESWQIRDSNGPLLESAMAKHAWISVKRCRVGDTLSAIEEAIEANLDQSDAVFLTGGVSMGDTDYVPQAIQNRGGEIVFHRIPIRPGKPLLGASIGNGKLIMGLPGNPMSVAVTFRRFGLGLLRTMAGYHGKGNDWDLAVQVPVHCDDHQTLSMLWFRNVVRQSDGSLKVDRNRGSGDVAALTRCDGFIEVPVGECAAGTRKCYFW